MKKIKELIFLLGLLSAGAAQASLVQDGTKIVDTKTNLQWMTLTSTIGPTYNQMLEHFTDPTSIFYGFRYATLEEVKTLFNDVGYAGDFADETYGSSQTAIQQLLDTFGETGYNCCHRGDGKFANTNGGLVDFLYFMPDFWVFAAHSAKVGILFDSTDPNGDFWDEYNGPQNKTGSWIVREANTSSSVPEPGSIALISLGIGLCGIFRRKHR